MRLLILRHGKAEQHSLSGRDDDRTLTDRGIRQAAWIGERLFGREAGAFERLPERVLCSPIKRAVQTAGAVCEYLGMHPEGAQQLTTDAPLSGIVDLLQVLVAQGVSTAMLVGHNPQLERLCAHLSSLDAGSRAGAGTGAEGGALTAYGSSLELRTGELFVFEIDLDAGALARGELNWPCEQIGRARLSDDDQQADKVESKGDGKRDVKGDGQMRSGASQE